MGRSAWSWSSKGRATASVTGLAMDGSTVTNDLELQALCPDPLESQSSIGISGSIGIPKLNWNLRGKACGHLCCLSRVARPSLRSYSRGILNNSKQIGFPGLDWNPRSAHTPHPRVLPRRARGSCSVWSSVTHTRATQEQISTSAHSSPAPCAASWRSCFAETFPEL